MKNKIAMAALAVVIAGPTMPSAAIASHHYYNHHSSEYRDGRVYHGNDRSYRRRCGGGNGAVGTVAGGAGGALLGNAVGGGTLGTIAGGVGGALLGRHLDKSHTRSRRGC